jgi:hypothetical protein
MRFLIKPRKESVCTNNFGKKTSEYPTGNPISGKRRERERGITKKKDCFFSER